MESSSNDAAGGVHELLVPAAEAVAHDDVSVFLRVTAGEPEGINGVLVDPLEVRYSAVSGADDVADATPDRRHSVPTGVETVIFTHSTAPQLNVHAAWPAESPERRELEAWLATHSYATTAGRPVAFTISGPAYATLTEGWVSAFSPPPPEPFTLPLPAGIDAWPDDADAAACTGADLELSYGGSDAATGARHAALLARNVSDNPCAVIGVPEIVFRNADGAAQASVGFEPYRPGVIPGRLVLPPGEQMLAAPQWSAMSTANDPDVTTFIEVIALPGTEPVRLDVTEHASSPAGLDILDGAQVRVGPWVQALEGHM